MGRRKRGKKINGWLIIDKPLGLGSTQAVAAVRRITGAQKAGHAGTLDPLATGILPIGLGEATKTMPFIVDASKSYEFTVRWGIATNTDDLEGEVVETADHLPTEAEIEDVLLRFTGRTQQVPPAYSAIKVGGKRAYALARGGDEVKLAAREVEILQLLHLGTADDGTESRFRVTCGKGTYVRSLGRDIARALGTCGHITALRRTRVGPFGLDASISLEKLEQLSHSAPAESYCLSVMTALADIPAVAVTESEAARIRCGNAVPLRDTLPGLANTQGPLCLVMDDSPLAIAKITDGMVQPLRVFNM